MHNGLNEIQPVYYRETERHSTKVSKNVIFKMTFSGKFTVKYITESQKRKTKAVRTWLLKTKLHW